MSSAAKTSSHVARRRWRTLSGIWDANRFQIRQTSSVCLELPEVQIGLSRVEQLNKEVFLPETEWLSSYEEYVAALRADIYAIAAGRVRSWNAIGGRGDDVVATAQEIVGERIKRSMPMVELGFIRFLADFWMSISHELGGVGCGIVRRIAYRRWKTSSYATAEADMHGQDALMKRIRQHRVEERRFKKWYQEKIVRLVLIG